MLHDHPLFSCNLERQICFRFFSLLFLGTNFQPFFRASPDFFVHYFLFTAFFFSCDLFASFVFIYPHKYSVISVVSVSLDLIADHGSYEIAIILPV